VSMHGEARVLRPALRGNAIARACRAHRQCRSLLLQIIEIVVRSPALIDLASPTRYGHGEGVPGVSPRP
jgi:hypothetical protein